MRLFLVLAFVFKSFVVCCESQKIQKDTQILQGMLDNGLSYYIRENKHPAGKASLRLVVRVGSNYEQEHEKGIAHFIEHLVFRGSEHFKDGEMEQYLESIGVSSGADSNAYTSFDSTVFWLDIPLDKELFLEKGLMILCDIASSAELSEEAIEKERHVVLDELYQNFSSPIYHLERKLVATLLPDTAYADHFPGGSEEIIKTVSAKTLHAFYQRWYRPDRMAVIAIGDFDSLLIQQKIAEAFGSLICSDDEVEEPDMDVRYAQGPVSTIHYDSELGGTEVEVISIKYWDEDQELFDDPYKKGFYSYVCTRLLKERLEKLEEAEIIFLDTYVSESTWYANTELFIAAAALFEDGFEEGLNALHYEIQKVLQHGFLQPEWEKLSKQMETEYKRALENAENTDNRRFADRCIDHFVDNRILASREATLLKLIELTRHTTVEEVNDYLPFSHLNNLEKIFLFTSSPKITSQLTENDLFELFHTECSTDQEVVETREIIFDIEPKFAKGEIIQIVEDPDHDVSYWTLSNKVRLILKKNNQESDCVSIKAQALGGVLSLPPELCHSAQLACSYGLMSGLNGITCNELDEVLNEKGISWDADLEENERFIHIRAEKESLEKAFQLIHAFFTEPRFDLMKWDYLKAVIKEHQKELSKDSDYQFASYVIGQNTQNHFYFDPLDLDQASEEDARKIFAYSFSAPREFTFAIVGGFDELEVAQLAEKYLASLPNHRQESFPYMMVPELFPKAVVKEEFKNGKKNYVNNIVTIPFSYTDLINENGNIYPVLAVKKLLSQRLGDALRNHLGKTYGVGVDFDFLFYPDRSNAFFQIDFTCQSEHRAIMLDALFAEVERLKTEPPHSKEVETVKALLMEKNKKRSRSNDYWTNMLLTSQRENIPLDKLNRAEKLIGDLSPEKMHEIAQMIFSSPYYSVISHLPE